MIRCKAMRGEGMNLDLDLNRELELVGCWLPD